MNRPAAGENFSTGKILTQTMDCKSCHRENEKSAGPAFMNVSEKYRGDKNALNYLMEKVTKGGSGVWGDVAMPAHPNVLQTDLQQIVQYILALSEKGAVKKSLPPSGTITPLPETKHHETLVLSAAYSNRGSGSNIKALSGRSVVVLPDSHISFTGKENKTGFTVIKKGSQNELSVADRPGWFSLDSIDLRGVSAVDIITNRDNESSATCTVTVKLDDLSGNLIGSGVIGTAAHATGRSFITSIKLKPVASVGFHTLYFMIIPKDKEPGTGINIESVDFK